MFRKYSIISINSICVPEKPPFSKRLWARLNLLVLHFDDVNEGDPNAMTEAQTRQIADFARRYNDWPMIIHCTAGVSRSGAVGDALNCYFNRHAERNNQAFEQFYRDNPDIVPNLYVRQKLWKTLQQTEN